MGADLYLVSEFEEQHEKWHWLFQECVRERDALPQDSPLYVKTQALVDNAYERMYQQGYFRDSYNSSSLLWQFGLSWWNDVSPLLEKDGFLGMDGMRRVLELLSERLTTFATALTALPLKEQRYFRAKHRRLVRFLNRAIRKNEPIRCSL